MQLTVYGQGTSVRVQGEGGGGGGLTVGNWLIDVVAPLLRLGGGLLLLLLLLLGVLLGQQAAHGRRHLALLCPRRRRGADCGGVGRTQEQEELVRRQHRRTEQHDRQPCLHRQHGLAVKATVNRGPRHNRSKQDCHLTCCVLLPNCRCSRVSVTATETTVRAVATSDEGG